MWGEYAICLAILFFFLFSTFSEGRMHDAGMLMESQLLQQLENSAFSRTGEALCLYGDPAYPLRNHLQAPFLHAALQQLYECSTNIS